MCCIGALTKPSFRTPQRPILVLFLHQVAASGGVVALCFRGMYFYFSPTVVVAQVPFESSKNNTNLLFSACTLQCRNRSSRQSPRTNKPSLCTPSVGYSVLSAPHVSQLFHDAHKEVT